MDAPDPLSSDGDKYKLVFENERVRVLEYRDKPGQKTRQHRHPDFVLCALSSFSRRLTHGDGRAVSREIEAGQAIWGSAQVHVGENIGTTDTHVIIVELKEARPASTAR